MLNQSFSSKTFQEIFDKENRKGKNIEKRFKEDFSESLESLSDIKSITQQIRYESDKDAKKALYAQRKEVKKVREKQILHVLEDTANKIVEKKLPIQLVLGESHGGQTYMFDETVENYFLGKKICDNINKTYNVKPSSRYSILSELINHLEDKFPKYVIRTDIKSFYESIPQKRLLEKINEDHLLSILTKKNINETFDSYNTLTGQNKETARGIPRGIGFSAYLAELYMRKIDNSIKGLKDLIYYARYVDDIIAIFIPKHDSVDATYLDNYIVEIEKIIVEEDLEINNTKTKEFNLMKNLDEIRSHTISNTEVVQYEINPNYITFLGYRIGSSKKYRANGKFDESISIEFSETKINSYKDKIKLAFNHFQLKKKHNRKAAFGLLKTRIHYLTSNTKLRNNKDKVFVGIYYSNSFLNNFKSLEVIQRSLDYYIGRVGLNAAEKVILKTYAFESGFKSKKVELFPIKNRKYKNHNCNRNDVLNRSNIGVLQYGLTEINSIWRK